MSLSSSWIKKPLSNSGLNNNLSKDICILSLESTNITQRHVSSTGMNQFPKNKRSISTKNLKMVGANKKNLRTSISSLRRSISPFVGGQTYKQDAIKLLARRINLKIKGYFNILKSGNLIDESREESSIISKKKRFSKWT